MRAYFGLVLIAAAILAFLLLVLAASRWHDDGPVGGYCAPSSPLHFTKVCGYGVFQ